MKVAVIHSDSRGWFPRYYDNLVRALEKRGHEVTLLLPRNRANKRSVLAHKQLWGTRINFHLHFLLFKLTGWQDCFSHFSTWLLIRRLKRLRPQLVHLHIVSNYILHLPMLLRYLSRSGIAVAWTFHDLRMLTGLCCVEAVDKCKRWHEGCGHCPYLSDNFHPLADSTHGVWRLRQRALASASNLHIIAPSEWMGRMVRLSALRKLPLTVIYNGQDLARFANHGADMREELGIGAGEVMVLGVASYLTEAKGLSDFIQMRRMLGNSYRIVLVGEMSKESKGTLPHGIIHLSTVTDDDKLIALYQSADVLVNPTYADNFPTTHVEALASGTPVVTYEVGGAAEAIDEHCGVVVKKGDVQALVMAVREVTSHPDHYSSEACRQQAELFSLNLFDDYVTLFEKMAGVQSSSNISATSAGELKR
ncbi:MAG: glycosyltransferase [Prevotella sp.]|nr:glycosyltransferase [Prevotella sp.]